MGFIYVGPKDDYGYNQAHAEGAAAVKKLPGVKVYEQEKVPENDDVQKTMTSMIETDGAKPHSSRPRSGYFDPHVLVLAKKRSRDHVPPLRRTLGSGQASEERRQLLRLHRRMRISRGHRGGRSHQDEETRLRRGQGDPAGSPQHQRLRCSGACSKTVDPEITVEVNFTNDWSDSVKEANATNTLIDNGCDVITCHVDSPKVVVETAVKRGKYVTGYHASQLPIAKDKYLTGAEWNWGEVYTGFVKDFQAGKTIKNMTRGGLKEGVVKMGPYGKDVTDAAKKKVQEVKDKFMAGTFVIFKGPLEDNDGKVVIPAGESQGQTDPKLESMGYLVKGVKGKL